MIKEIKNIGIKLISRLMIIMSVLAVQSCNKEKSEPDNPTEPEQLETTVLVYAVASNNLEASLGSDKREMLRAASELNLNECRLLVYQVTNSGNPTLQELVKTNDGYEFKVIKEYDRNTFSTDPKRLMQVIDDAERLRPSKRRGIVFWSHGAGWVPAGSDHVVPDSYKQRIAVSDNVEMKPDGWFGWDTIDSNSADHLDIIEMAEALPDDYFEFIWFDCCYMSTIETIYELRNKCRYFVGYPMEIAVDGMPYDLTIPFIVKKNPNLVAAADALCDYYFEEQLPVAVMVGDMSKLQELADAVRSCREKKQDINTLNLFTYSRHPYGPYYEFKQYWIRSLADNDAEIETINKALEDFVIFKKSSKEGFNRQTIPQDEFCGISTIIYNPNDVNASYYARTSWGKDVILAE